VLILGSGFVLLAWIVVWIAGFVDALTSDSTKVRIMPKFAWLIVILIFTAIAAVAWFAFGRPKAGVPGVARREGSGFGEGLRWNPPSGFTRPSTPKRADPPADPTGWQLGGAGGARRRGPIAPDDDPEFLRQLGRRKPDSPSGENDTPKP
jgi:Phospholipase_D-nuclease N-terminal